MGGVSGKAEKTMVTGMKGTTTITWVTGIIWMNRMNINEMTWMTGTIWITGMICMIRMNRMTNNEMTWMAWMIGMMDDLDDWNGLHDD